jgi:hypothetical protein
MPEPEQVRLRLWAERMALEEYDHGDGYAYTPEQVERNRVKRADRVRWLMLRGPYVPPESKLLTASRERYERGELS